MSLALESFWKSLVTVIVTCGFTGSLYAQDLSRSTSPEVARLYRQLEALRLQNKTLARSLADANRTEKESSQALSQIKTRLAALGKSVFSDQDQRLIEAVSSVELLKERNARLEEAALDLAGNIQGYLTTAVASDPETRLKVEESIRKLDSVLGLSHKPRPHTTAGTLKSASVVSIDSESGMLVFNVGTKADARIGQTFTVLRGDQKLGEATIVDVRASISGAFIDELTDKNTPVRSGDAVTINTVSN